jgi:aminopeptidase N
VAWIALWDMVRDAKLPARQFVPLVLNNIQGETDIGVVQDLLGRVSSAIEVYGDPENVKALSQVVAEHALDALRKAQPSSDLQLVWARTFITSADRPEHLAIVRGLLDGSVTYPGLKVDTDLRWSIVTTLASKDPNSEQLIASELERDPTDMGQRHAARARAIRPSKDAKSDAWKAVTKDKELPLAMLRSIMAGFQQFDQVELEKPYVDRYFENLDPIWKSREIEVALAYARMLYPSVVIGDEVLKKTRDYLAGDAVPGPVRRILMESQDAMERAMRGRMVDAASAALAAV